MVKPIKYGKEYRAFSMPDLTADSGNIIQGHAAVFNQTTNIGNCWNEIVLPGAFDGCDFRDVLMSVNHDLHQIPLARSRNNNSNSTLQLQVDNQGLAIRATLDLDNNSQAKALYSAVSRGDIQGMSLIFVVADDEWTDLDTDMPTRTIRSISQVIEVSAVSFPAYAGTDINARGKESLESVRQALESAKASKLESLNMQRDFELRKRKILLREKYQ